MASREPPDELADFELRCARRGVRFRLVWPDDSPQEFAERTALYEEWCAEREVFSREYGWHGGRAVRREQEGAIGLIDLYTL